MVFLSSLQMATFVSRSPVAATSDLLEESLSQLLVYPQVEERLDKAVHLGMGVFLASQDAMVYIIY